MEKYSWDEDVEALLEALEEEDSYAPAWNREDAKLDEGDTLIGEVTGLSERESDYGDHEVYPIVTVRQKDGEELAFHAGGGGARGPLERAAPQVGDRIAIRYEGERNSTKNKGKKYKLYKVRVLRG